MTKLMTTVSAIRARSLVAASGPFDVDAARQLTAALDASHGFLRVSTVLRNARLFVRFARFVAALPMLGIEVSTSPAGRRMATSVNRGVLGVRLPLRICQAVLAVPVDEPSILTGRRNQALRTNLRRAHDDGLTVRCITEPADRAALLTAFTVVVPELLHKEADLRESIPQDVWMAVFDSRGMPLSLLVATVDRYAALLRYLVTRAPATAQTARSRYLVHTELVRLLVQKRVAYLLVESESPLRIAAGLRYFQARLGYEFRNIRCVRS